MAEPSIFSRIIAGEIPAHKVYEDDKVLAFLDINPRSKGHTLVIPKQQVDHFDDLPTDLYLHVMEVVQRISKQLKQKLSPLRVGLAVVGTDIPHAHVHLVPIYTGEEMEFRYPGSEPSNEELSALARELQMA